MTDERPSKKPAARHGSAISPTGLSEADEKTLLELLEGVRRGGCVIGRPVPVLKHIIRPDFTWDDAVPGLTFPPLEYRVSLESVKHYLRLASRVVDTKVSATLETVPPMMFADEPMQCVATLFGRSSRLHVGHRIEHFRSVPIGALVRSCGRVANRFERSDRQFINVECVISVIEDGAEYRAVGVTATLLP